MGTVHTAKEKTHSFLNTNLGIPLLCGGTLNVYPKLNFQMNCTGKKARPLLKLSLRSFVTAYLLTMLTKPKKKGKKKKTTE